MLAVIAALEQELAPLRKRLGARNAGSETGLRLCQAELPGTPLLLAQTGMGPTRSREVAATLVERYHPKAILSIGLAGALREDLRAGDLVIASLVHDVREEREGEPLAISDGLACDPRLVELAVAAARQRGLDFHVGSSLSVRQMVDNPQMKRRLGCDLPVAIVEMESYWVGCVASQHGIPFLAMRAISDEAGERLPEFQGVVDAEGVVRALPALSLLLRRPLYARTFLRLARNARRAAQNLATLVEAFARSFPPEHWSEP